MDSSPLAETMLSRVDNSLSVLRDPGRLRKSSPRPPGAELKSLRAGSRLQLTSNYPAFQKMLSGHAPRHVQEPSLIPAHVSVCSLEGTSPVLWGSWGLSRVLPSGGYSQGTKTMDVEMPAVGLHTRDPCPP